MNFKDLQKQLKAMKGVTEISLIRKNVIKLDLDKSISKEFFTKLKEEYYFEHCSLITAIDNQPDFELVYHLSCFSGELSIGDTKMAAMVEIHIHLERVRSLHSRCPNPIFWVTSRR